MKYEKHRIKTLKLILKHNIFIIVYLFWAVEIINRNTTITTYHIVLSNSLLIPIALTYNFI